MQRLLASMASFLALAMLCPPVLAQEATLPTSPVVEACDAPALPTGTPTTRQEGPDPGSGSPTTGLTPPAADATPAPLADEATAARVLSGIENFVACRNLGDYEAYAALLTPNRMLVEVGTANPWDVVADLQAFNLPITTLSLGDVRSHPDGRLSAEFVHLFGAHLYYRSRLFVVEEDGYVKLDEERYLPEEPPGEQSAIDVGLVDFAFESSQEPISNAQYVVLRGTNEGDYLHEIVVVRLPEGATVEQALAGEVPEEQIEFIGQTAIGPGQADDLVLVNLEPGTYTLLCFVDEPDGVPHAAKGMVAQVTIDGAAPPTP